MSDTLERVALARAAHALQSGALPSLIFMTDEDRVPASDLERAIIHLPPFTLVILRARSAQNRHSLLNRLLPLIRPQQLLLSIAGDPALAMQAGVDGIHLSEKNIGHAARLRATHGGLNGLFITAAVHSARMINFAYQAGADAALLSPIFPTQSHPQACSIGPMRLRLIAQRAQLPLYALGGVDATTVKRLAHTPLAGVAAISGLLPDV